MTFGSESSWKTALWLEYFTVVYNISDLEAVAKKYLKDRQDEVVRAEVILEEELARFFAPVAGAVR